MTARGSWSRSAARPAAGRQARPGGSFGLALARARAVWDDLTGGPDAGTGRYTDSAAAAIVGLALGLWADTAASMGAEGADDG